MKRSLFAISTILSFMLVTLLLPVSALAEGSSTNLSISTTYPSEVIQLGESISISLNVKATDTPQTVDMSMGEIPDGWTATFRGGGKIIQSVFVDV